MSKISAKGAWNLSLLLKDETLARVEKEKEIITKGSYSFINKWKARSDYLDDPKILKDALDEYEHWAKHFGTSGSLGYYFSLKSSKDQTDPEIKAQRNKLEDFGTKILNDVEFFTIRISKISEKKQKEFLEYKDLSGYKHFLEGLFESAKYILSEPEEKIMNLKEKTSLTNWIKLSSELISKEERGVKGENGVRKNESFSQLLSLASNKNKKVRDAAAKALESIFKKHLDVIEAEINTVCENQKINDGIRGYPRPDSRRHLADDIETEIVDTLIEVVSSRFDIPKRYYKLKTELLGLKKMRYYERTIEYGNIKAKYTYQKAAEIVYETFKELDGAFAEIFKNFAENGQIDAFPKKGKKNGAFCGYDRSTDPTYILLNHTDRLNDVLTIAHEAGHGINNELMKTQNELNFGVSTATAEVASTFMEDFVLQKLLSKAGDEEKLAIIMMRLDSDVASIFRQVAFYMFEQHLHASFRRKGYLTAKEIGSMFKKHMKDYTGEVSDGCDNWWVHVEHFRYFFYVYSYASGLLISKALQNMVKNDSGAMGKVKDFLSAGRSDSPKNIFKKLGIDIADKDFWHKGLEEVEFLLNEAEGLARRLGKI
ncbi:M3 family oligoendopeptidase [candidate division WWE3 bacterium]|nr:M3 family oligoendopeptidase [candidate division WWE3 bacterium]